MKIQFCEIKGAKLAVFADCYNAECSFQKDVVQGHSLMWIGVNRDFQGKPAQRMLLDKERASILAKILTNFVERDSVPTSHEEMPDGIQVRPEKQEENAPSSKEVEPNIEPQAEKVESTTESKQNEI